MPAISASMKTFLESDGFEDAVRRARVFNSVFIGSIKKAMGRYCLDEGIGIFDKNRTSNLIFRQPMTTLHIPKIRGAGTGKLEKYQNPNGGGKEVVVPHMYDSR